MPARSRCYTRWLDMCTRLNASLGRALGKVGLFSAAQPFVVIVSCVLVTLLCTPGFLHLEVESSSNKLWVKQDCEAKKRFDAASDLFSEPPYPFRFLIQAKDTGSNALTVDAFKDAFSLLDEAWGARSAGLIYSDLCSKDPAGKCRGEGALRFFDCNRTVFEATIATSTLLDTLSAEQYSNGQRVNRDGVFGSVVTSGSRIVSAPVWRLDLLAQPGHVTLESILAWQKGLIDRFVLEGYQRVNQRWPHIHMELWASGRSMQDEVERNTSGDFMFMLCAYVFLVMSVALLLGPPHKCVQGRRMFGTMDFFIVLAAIMAGYGIATGLKIPFTSLQQILPFILVGVGVDDAYVIIVAFDGTDHSTATKERVREALEEVGMSITLTSATSFLSFLTGALFSSFPGLRYFCAYACFSLLFVYMFHLTAFCAILALDTRRQHARRWDVLCCVKASAHSEAEAIEASSPAEWVMEKFGEAITSSILVKIAIVSVFLCSGSLSLWQAVENTDTNFSILDMISDDSYMREFFDAETKYWGGDSTSLDQLIHCPFTGIEQHDASIQAQMTKVENMLLALKCVREESGIVSWHRQFDAWAIIQKHNPGFAAHDFKQVGGREFLTGHSFELAVKYWLSDPHLGLAYQRDVVFKGGIHASRVTVVQENAPSADDKADFLTEIDTFIDDAQQYLPNTFAVSRMHMLADANRRMRMEAISTVSGCVCCALVVSTFIISHPVALAMVFGAMLSVFIHLMGWLPLLGMPLNAITLVNMIMAIGLVVDYMLHIVHSFLAQDSKLSRDERTVCAMKKMGVSVFLGIFSTFVAVVPLVFARSEVFRIFLKMFVGIFLAGGLHGLVLVPVMLSLVGPAEVNTAKVMSSDDGDLLT